MSSWHLDDSIRHLFWIISLVYFLREENELLKTSKFISSSSLILRTVENK